LLYQEELLEEPIHEIYLEKVDKTLRLNDFDLLKYIDLEYGLLNYFEEVYLKVEPHDIEDVLEVSNHFEDIKNTHVEVHRPHKGDVYFYHEKVDLS